MSSASDPKKTGRNEVEYNFVDRSAWLVVGNRHGPWGIRFNPVTFIVSLFGVWAFTIWCILSPDQANNDLVNVKEWITKIATWLYVFSQDIWLIFLIIVLFSKYSKLRLGKPDEQPEYSTLTWFTMLFAAGIGIGLFFYGVSEPISHFRGNPEGSLTNRWAFVDESCRLINFNDTSPSDQMYLRMNWNAWTGDTPPNYSQIVKGQVVQGSNGDTYGLVCMPNDNKRALNALLVTMYNWGVHAWVVYCLVGLLLGFMSFRKGLPLTMKSAFYPLIKDKIFSWLGDAIDVISVLCTIFGVSTSLGLGAQQISTGLSRINSSIKADVTTQIILIWAITAVATVSAVSGVGVGIRRLSETTFGLGLLLMTMVCFLDNTWYILNLFVETLGYYVWKLIPIMFHTDAFEQLDNAPDDQSGREGWYTGWTLFYWGWWISWSPFVGTFIATISRGRKISEFIVCVLFLPTLYSLLWFSIFGGAALKMQREAEVAGATYARPVIQSNGETLYNLYGRPSNEPFFDVLSQYGDVGETMLFYVAVTAVTLYFVTSSDSGSLVVDSLTSNGQPDSPPWQRVFWACTEGAAATALLKSGGERGLSALQSVSISGGLPLTVMLCFMAIALWNAFKDDQGDIDFFGGPQWHIHSLDFAHWPSFKLAKDTLQAIFIPWWYHGRAAKKCFSDKATMCVQAITFNCWWIFLLADLAVHGLWALGWTMYLAHTVFLMGTRKALRERDGIHGDLLSDFFLSLILYPSIAVQVNVHAFNYDPEAIFAGTNGEKDSVAV